MGFYWLSDHDNDCKLLPLLGRPNVVLRAVRELSARSWLWRMLVVLHSAEGELAAKVL